MKKSKRLLSILLMLTMLVSMFTVMASAADPCSHENKEFYAAKDATCKTKGNIQYYLCKDCGKKFLNEAMTDEVPFGAVTTGSSSKKKSLLAKRTATRRILIAPLATSIMTQQATKPRVKL